MTGRASSRRLRNAVVPGRLAGAAAPAGAVDRAALRVVRTGIALILLVPFAVTGTNVFMPLVVGGERLWFPPTIYPMVVGKAVLFRSLIEIVFAAWAVLAVRNPAYRPPRSLPLALLGAALAAASLSALFGASVARSLFSTYARMGGVVDQAHWFALALVLVSVVRAVQWRTLLNSNLAVGASIGLWAVGQHFGVEALLWESEGGGAGYRRITATLGNPIALGAYALVNSLVAAGFLVESLASRGASAADGTAGAGASARRPRRAANAPRAFPPLGWRRAFWGFCALLGAWVVVLTATRSSLLGLLAGLAAVAALFASLERGRARLAVVAAAGLLAAAAAAVAVVVAAFEPEPGSRRSGSGNPFARAFPIVERAFATGTGEMRLAAWDAAAKGFLERPALGWGPENFHVVHGRHGEGIAGDMPVHDDAHGRIMEELAAGGALGLAAHLAVWAGLLAAGFRAARRMGRRERIPLVFAGGALAGCFAHGLVSPDAPTGALQFTLLFAFVASAARGTERPPPARRPPARRALAAAAVAAAAGLAGLGLWTNRAAFKSSSATLAAMENATSGGAPRATRDLFAEAAGAFAPMATHPALFLFQYASQAWGFLHARDPAEAARLLELVEAEAARAVRREPRDWRVRVRLARVYAAVAAVDPRYLEAADREMEAARELAPGRREVRALAPPGPARR